MQTTRCQVILSRSYSEWDRISFSFLNLKVHKMTDYRSRRIQDMEQRVKERDIQYMYVAAKSEVLIPSSLHISPSYSNSLVKRGRGENSMRNCLPLTTNYCRYLDSSWREVHNAIRSVGFSSPSI